ncbi:MAG: VanZ family protein [Solobacterium sp.]|nr:VanZ family protein [Solobacterium sp.]
MNRKRKVLYTVFYVYLCIVLFLTLMPIAMQLPQLLEGYHSPINWELFRDWRHMYGDYRLEIIYNVLLFVPFGFLHQQIFRCRWRTTLLLGFLFSLCIELVQPLLSYTRVADVTDLFDNTLGTFIGIITWHLIHYFVENLKLRNHS